MTTLTKVVNGEIVPLSAEEVKEFEAMEVEHLRQVYERAKVKYRDQRRAEYPLIEDLVVALIEKEEGRPEALNSILAVRADIKAKYPKP